jgi:branched-chain amino acid aminotransferase
MAAQWVCMDGEVVPAAEAMVPVTDRGFMYGDGVFETLRSYGGQIFAWEQHSRRLRSGCERLGIELGVDDGTLGSWVDALLAANEITEAYLKIMVSRGVTAGRLRPSQGASATVVIVCEPLTRGGHEGAPSWQTPAKCAVVETQRTPDAAVPSGLKPLAYLNGIIAHLAAPGWADEPLLCDLAGHVTEGAVSNLFIVTDAGLQTPPAAGDLLAGVTRTVVCELAAGEGLPVVEDPITPELLYAADEAFLTNTTWEIRPVERVDAVHYEPGPVTALLRHRYDAEIEEFAYG